MSEQQPKLSILDARVRAMVWNSRVWLVKALAVVFVLAFLLWGGITLYENHVSAAAAPTSDLPEGYLRASPSFLRDFDSLVDKQQKLNDVAAGIQRRVPQGYAFDGGLRAFKPMPKSPAQNAPPESKK